MASQSNPDQHLIHKVFYSWLIFGVPKNPQHLLDEGQDFSHGAVNYSYKPATLASDTGFQEQTQGKAERAALTITTASRPTM